MQATTDTPNLGHVTTLVKRIAACTLIAEVAGAAVLGVAFALRGQDLVGAAWWGVFHSVSAFNNAGFDLTGGFRTAIFSLVVFFVIGGLLLWWADLKKGIEAAGNQAPANL